MNLYRNDNLRAAFDLYVREQDALLPTKEELSSVTLSPEFHARMAKLLARRRRGYYRMFGTWGRRVASILIALLVATTTVTFSVKALREKVIEFFAEVFGTHTVVTFVDDKQDVPDEIAFEPRMPSYIPDGYVVETEEYYGLAYEITYVNSDGNRIQYDQMPKDNMKMTLDTENVEYRNITIGSYQGVVYTNKGRTVAIFVDEEYVYRFSGILDEDEMVKIFKSIFEK